MKCILEYIYLYQRPYPINLVSTACLCQLKNSSLRIMLQWLFSMIFPKIIFYFTFKKPSKFKIYNFPLEYHFLTHKSSSHQLHYWKKCNSKKERSQFHKMFNICAVCTCIFFPVSSECKVQWIIAREAALVQFLKKCTLLLNIIGSYCYNTCSLMFKDAM